MLNVGFCSFTVRTIIENKKPNVLPSLAKRLKEGPGVVLRLHYYNFVKLSKKISKV